MPRQVPRQIIAALVLLLALAGCAAGSYRGPVLGASDGTPLPPVKPAQSASAAGTQYAALPGRITLPEPGARGPTTVSEADRYCLAQAIYFEAGMLSPAAERSVGDVILNRVADPRFPDTICNVIHEGGEAARGRCQFSWWCDGRSDEPVERDRWLLAEQSADEVLSGDYADQTDGALFFHNKSVRPSWSRRLQKTATIGGHIFYR